MTMLTADLVAYQHRDYAAQFVDRVEQVHRQDPRLTETVARSLHKLMAYKDEYEVARLLLADESRVAAERVGGRGATITWRLHPPMLKAIGRRSKLGVTDTVGRPLMTASGSGKRLRGTRLDPFGRTEMRRTERALIGEYHAQIDAELAHLGAHPDDIDGVLEALALPMAIRGYEDLKLRRVAEYRAAVATRTQSSSSSSIPDR